MAAQSCQRQPGNGEERGGSGQEKIRVGRAAWLANALRKTRVSGRCQAITRMETLGEESVGNYLFWPDFLGAVSQERCMEVRHCESAMQKASQSGPVQRRQECNSRMTFMALCLCGIYEAATGALLVCGKGLKRRALGVAFHLLAGFQGAATLDLRSTCQPALLFFSPANIMPILPALPCYTGAICAGPPSGNPSLGWTRCGSRNLTTGASGGDWRTSRAGRPLA